MLDFEVELLAAVREFVGALPVEQDAVLTAVQFERGLAQHILVLPQLGFEFVGARANPLLLALHLRQRV